MKFHARIVPPLCAVLALLTAPHAHAQTTTPPARDAVEIDRIIAGTAKKTGKKFLVDPRVRAQVTLVGLDPDNLDYPTFLSVLQMHGFAAFDDGKYIRVVPDASARQQPIPLLTGNGSYADAEYVSRVISVKNVPAAMLVPLLRPLLPQQAHMVAFPCTNTLLLVDTFANVKRVEKIISSFDTGEPFKPEKCGAPAPKAD
ncbi:secretin N-terminal domain-containing protein [Steroidobacter flavus]|uniref:Secretin N-terminal domain-containing protein n=1 Tax=Steroidobacter flavus TaxID=1842136 RepID=A0ABV8T6W2_9GAMM